MDADKFARRVRAKLDGSPLVLAPEDAAMLAACGIIYTSSAPVFYDPDAPDQLESVSSTLDRYYGAGVRVYLPHVE